MPPGRPQTGTSEAASNVLRPSLRDRLLDCASEYATLEAEVRQLKGESVLPPGLVDPPSEDSGQKGNSTSPSLNSGSGRCGDVFSLSDCCSPPSVKRSSSIGPKEKAETASQAQRSAPQLDPSVPRAQLIREQLLECAAEYESLLEENRQLAREIQRRDEIGNCQLGLQSRSSADYPGNSAPSNSFSLRNVEAQARNGTHTDEPETKAGPEPPIAPEQQEMEPPATAPHKQSSQEDEHTGEMTNDETTEVGPIVPLEDCLQLPSDEGGNAKHSTFRGMLSRFMDRPAYKAVIVVCLVIALFGGGTALLLDVPDQPGNDIIDVIMSTILVVFALEVILNCIDDWKVYPRSFFFWMDVLGTFSMLFEISRLPFSPNGKIKESSSGVDAMILRTARAAKVGARSGRLFKLMKCLSLLFRHQEKRSSNVQSNGFEAKVISQRLMVKLSTRVSCTVIVLVLLIPFLQISLYPETDMSMRSWGQRLEHQYALAYQTLAAEPQINSTNMFQSSLEELVAFYSEVNYRPYMIEGYDEEVDIYGRRVTITSSPVLPREPPKRKQNIWKQVVQTCALDRPACQGDSQPALLFNFSEPTKMEVIMDMLLIVLVISVMGIAACDLSKTIDLLLVKPLERMLGMLHMYASNILEQVMKAHGAESMEDSETSSRHSEVAETDLLEDIMRKLARLAQLSTQKTAPQDLDSINHEGQGVILEIMNLRRTRATTAGSQSGQGLHSVPLGRSMASMISNQRVAELPMAVEVVESWDMHILECSSSESLNVVLHIFYDSEVGTNTGRVWLQPETFRRFYTLVAMEYQDVPYHCFAHAIDVLHTVFQFLRFTQSNKWLSNIDQYALLVAALCHDVGHGGRTNPFLVETRHTLALLYNDRSPLENMHCAKLFEICNQAETDAFVSLDAEGRRQARKVCIATILHTDNVNHMEMVKEISRIYEVLSDICEFQAGSPAEISQRYSQEVLLKDTMTWLELFLHLADVSNPLKPFKICQVWAWRVLEEFFAQGDEEKQLGLPVGMLNDRNKVNRPGSQHGFINFMVAPLVTASVRLFPALHALATEMANNLEKWRDIWIQDTQPSSEEVAKRDDEVQKIRSEAEELRLRVTGRASRSSTQRSRRGTVAVNVDSRH